MFDQEKFVEDCREALAEDSNHKAVREVVARAVSDPAVMINGLREPKAGAMGMMEKDAHPLGPDIIHSVTNPIPRLTGAIHVYGGDFFRHPRSEWDPEDLTEHPYDIEKVLRAIEASSEAAA